MVSGSPGITFVARGRLGSALQLSQLGLHLLKLLILLELLQQQKGPMKVLCATSPFRPRQFLKLLLQADEPGFELSVDLRSQPVGSVSIGKSGSKGCIVSSLSGRPARPARFCRRHGLERHARTRPPDRNGGRG